MPKLAALIMLRYFRFVFFVVERFWKDFICNFFFCCRRLTFSVWDAFYSIFFFTGEWFSAVSSLQHFRANIDDLGLLYDLCFVFLNQFTSDFSFFRIFVEEQIIPVWSCFSFYFFFNAPRSISFFLSTFSLGLFNWMAFL